MGSLHCIGRTLLNRYFGLTGLQTSEKPLFLTKYLDFYSRLAGLLLSVVMFSDHVVGELGEKCKLSSGPTNKMTYSFGSKR